MQQREILLLKGARGLRAGNSDWGSLPGSGVGSWPARETLNGGGGMACCVGALLTVASERKVHESQSPRVPKPRVHESQTPEPYEVPKPTESHESQTPETSAECALNRQEPTSPKPRGPEPQTSPAKLRVHGSTKPPETARKFQETPE
nr:pollen-specific leucine-rich repeat extensin-like protein 1 [Penaeus vannamei]